LRSTHFHAGIDVRTNNMTGVPIRATQSGYISRVTVGSYGYGKVMFITHPDGNTSVYGHLDAFRGPVAVHVKNEHYQRKSFDLDLTFEPNQFIVKQGDTIAVSGNTGGSNGAHLHFEIRNQNNEALNPLSFGFTEIADDVAPIAQKVALKTMDINARINDRFGRFEFGLVKSGNSYSLPFPILANGKIGIEILAHDKLDKLQFRTGINLIEAFVEGEKFFTQQIDRINFEASRTIQVVMDYEVLKQKGNRFNKLYVDDGNKLPYYSPSGSKGIVNVADKEVSIQIKLTDLKGNESNVNFKLKPSPTVEQLINLPVLAKAVTYDIVDNTLIVSSKLGSDKQCFTFVKGEKTEKSPSYESAQQLVYLFDLRKSLPDSIQTPAGSLVFNFKSKVPSRTEYTYYSDPVDIEFQKESLYDTLFLSIQYKKDSLMKRISIGNPMVPLFQPIQVTLKSMDANAVNKQTGLYRSESGRLSFLNAEWVNNQLRFSTRDFGEFMLLRDTTPPSITRVRCNSIIAQFRIRDNLSGISYFEASVEGEWLLMHYDYKTGMLQSEKLDKTKPLKGDFVLKVVDNAGNEKVFKQKII
jgi:Membrane proteins related to metalloendopeptidases